ncbi:MAG: GNAT family N-acetyltransferase [Aquincola sp.]|nr:GNAT family N-acetyltransferase [Aquincola sp.]
MGSDGFDAARWRETPTLIGGHVRLEPLSLDHVDALIDASKDGELWRLWFTSIPEPAGMRAYVETALARRNAGTAMPFVVRDGNGVIVGTTRYGHMEPENRRLEIGWTWYAKRVQRTALNTEAKRMLLRHAFDVLGCGTVIFCTNWFNHASRAAIARLGAKQDGVLRNHMRMADGSYRDTVVFSILANEWPMVRTHLEHRLGRAGEGAE